MSVNLLLTSVEKLQCDIINTLLNHSQLKIVSTLKISFTGIAISQCIAAYKYALMNFPETELLKLTLHTKVYYLVIDTTGVFRQKPQGGGFFFPASLN